LLFLSLHTFNLHTNKSLHKRHFLFFSFSLLSPLFLALQAHTYILSQETREGEPESQQQSKEEPNIKHRIAEMAEILLQMLLIIAGLL